MKQKDPLTQYTKELEASFARWDYLYENGGQDPFYADGVNLNLIRNHILSWKRQIEEYIAKQEEAPTLFGTNYPDIYYRNTPETVPPDYMAKADAIRERAKEQFALYENDPNFNYILNNFEKAFPYGETRETKKYGLYMGKFSHLRSYEKFLKKGTLVDLRRSFYEPYEKKAEYWAQAAQELKNYLEIDHSQADNSRIYDENLGLDEDLEEVFVSQEEPKKTEESVKKPSLDEKIAKARDKQIAEKESAKELPKEAEIEQLSLF